MLRNDTQGNLENRQVFPIIYRVPWPCGHVFGNEPDSSVRMRSFQNEFSEC